MSAAAYLEFLTDAARQDIYLYEITARRYDGGATETLRLSTGEFATAPGDTPASTQYRADATELFRYDIPVVDIEASGITGTLAGGSFEFGNKQGAFDAWRTTYILEGASVTIKHGGSSVYGTLDFADFETIRVAEIESAEFGLEAIRFNLRDQSARFDHPLEDRVLRGGSSMIRGNGTSGYITYADATKMDLRGDVSAAWWFYPYAIAATHFITGWVSANPFSITVRADGSVRISRNAATLYDSTVTLAADGIYHVGISYDVSEGAGLLVVYDYIAKTTTTETWSDGGVAGNAPTGAYYTAGDGTSSIWTNGCVDELVLWDEPKTADDFETIRWRQLTAAEAADANVILYHPFDDGTGATASDESSSPQDGTLNGALAWRRSLTGGLGDAAGTPLPNVFGPVKNYPGILVDPLTNTHQVHSGQIDGFDFLRQGGAAKPAGSVNTYTDLETFLAATTPEGEVDTLNWAGGAYYRFARAAENLPFSADFRGHARGGTYVSTAAEITREVITTCGPEPVADPGGLVTATFTALDTADASADHRIVARPGETIRSFVDRLLASCGARLYDTNTGAFAVHQFNGVTGATAAYDLTEADVVADSISELKAQPPVWKVVIPFDHNPLQLTSDQISLLVTEGEDGGSGPDVELWKFLRRNYALATVSRTSVRDTWPRAATIELRDSTYVLQADAQREAARRLALRRTKAQLLSATFTSRAIALDRNDEITLHFQDRDLIDDLQSRLGLDADTTFIALGVTRNPNQSEAQAVIYRQDSLS